VERERQSLSNNTRRVRTRRIEMVLSRRNLVTVAVIGVALVLGSLGAFAQFDPIDHQQPPDPSGGGGTGSPGGTVICVTQGNCMTCQYWVFSGGYPPYVLWTQVTCW
jgi:hypothetical protein